MLRYTLWMLVIFLLGACNGNNDTNIVSNREDSLKHAKPRHLYDFAVYKNDFGIPLKGWEHELRLEDNLGTPLSETVNQLGPGADTHMGAYLKELKYQGLKILLYGPNSPDTAWIMKMVVAGNDYTTARGLKTGMDTSRIIELYPQATKWPDGKRDQSRTPYFISNESDQLYLRFYVGSGKVDSIELYHDLP